MKGLPKSGKGSREMEIGITYQDIQDHGLLKRKLGTHQGLQEKPKTKNWKSVDQERNKNAEN